MSFEGSWNRRWTVAMRRSGGTEMNTIGETTEYSESVEVSGIHYLYKNTFTHNFN